MSGLRLVAPAKINWSLEVLRKRADGYHEIRSVLQTLDLNDVVTLRAADQIELEIAGDAGALAGQDPERNLAYRGAVAFRARTRVKRGVRITLEKHIPVAAGLGGGSSDAAAVLRGLNVLWDAGQPHENLAEIAAEIGSDPPFFMTGGTAVVSGRGEEVTPLPDAIAPSIVIASPHEHERGEKTAAMYAALEPAHYSDGDATIGVRETIEAAKMLMDAHASNVFEHVVAEMQPATANAMIALRAQGLLPHLCGSGPSFFLLAHDEASMDDAIQRVRAVGFDARPARVLPRPAATAIEHI